ncbi:MAG: FHA domain-containing protein [Chloroflexota bacterium]
MKKSQEDYPLLIAQEGPLKGQRWQLSQTIVLGREATCDVTVADRQISRFHARLTPTSEGIMLEDLGSKNGTYLNGALLSAQVVLQDGDVLSVAMAQQFMFIVSDATTPLLDGPSQHGRLMMDLKSRRVWVNQQQLVPPLSAQQFKLLWLLYERDGQVVTRPDLVAVVWGDDQMLGVSDQALDALIRRLRERIAALDPTYHYIDTVRGHGIRLDNPKS